jgi:hypothetical protein
VAAKPGVFNKWRIVIRRLRNGIITPSIWNASFDTQSDRGTCIGSNPAAFTAVRIHRLAGSTAVRAHRSPVSTAVEERPFQSRVSGPKI